MFLYAHHNTVLIFGIHRVKTQKIENSKKEFSIFIYYNKYGNVKNKAVYERNAALDFFPYS